MSVPRLLGRRRPAIIATATAACLVAAGAWFASGSASAGTLSGTLYTDPDSQVVRWVAANAGDSRMPVIRDKIASQPQARWMSTFNLSTVQSEVSTFIEAANTAGQVPVMSVYEITNRDCGGASAGGAPDLTQYQTWVSAFAQALGSQTVIIVLETDSLALQTCLGSTELAERNQALTTATQTIKTANANAKVYLDGGHSAWNSASVQAGRLRDAGIEHADGFYTNVSNFQPTENEVGYGQSIISSLSGMGISGKTQVIDTSRNGGASGDWCADDNTDRRIGRYPTLDTGDANIDGYLWIKPPGEADGCAYTAGAFIADLAYSLAADAAYPAVTPSSESPSAIPPSESPSATPPSESPSATPSSASPSAQPSGCTAAYQVTNSWQGGFQGQVTVTAGSSAVNGWSVAWALASDQGISQVWNGELSVSGSNVTVTNTPWNGGLASSSSTQFGFIATGSASAPAVTCTAS
ncbi:MAG: cellobiohydrolase [Dactylosporangium sp.]|nr:glycoside hydrolase family 6 protein [Dactylosporangium sp.]NNJ61992.1 cellobiohydrolase [Dactylosporangium sp.]